MQTRLCFAWWIGQNHHGDSSGWQGLCLTTLTLCSHRTDHPGSTVVGCHDAGMLSAIGQLWAETEAPQCRCKVRKCWVLLTGCGKVKPRFRTSINWHRAVKEETLRFHLAKKTHNRHDQPCQRRLQSYQRMQTEAANSENRQHDCFLRIAYCWKNIFWTY